jgi:hypothetical protein
LFEAVDQTAVMRTVSREMNFVEDLGRRREILSAGLHSFAAAGNSLPFAAV